jgi:hypothetical protein
VLGAVLDLLLLQLVLVQMMLVSQGFAVLHRVLLPKPLTRLSNQANGWACGQ